MAKYHIAGTLAAAAAGAALVDFRTSATDRARLLELGLWNTAATATTISLLRQTTLGTATAPVSPVSGEPSEAAATLLVGSAWSVAPAATGQPIRRMTLPANVGSGVIWSFGPQDLIIPISSSLVVMNTGGAAASILNFYAVIDE